MSELHTRDGFNLDGYNGLSQSLAQPFEDAVHLAADDVIDPSLNYLHDVTGWSVPGISHVDPSYTANDFVDRWFTRPISDAVQPLLQWISPVDVPQPLLVGIETNPGPPKKSTPKMVQHQKANKPAPARQSAPRRRNPATTIAAPAPVAVSYGAGVHIGQPIIKRSNDACTIEHTELIGSVTGSVGWSTGSYPLQPGLSSTFAWLATQTSGWEKYRFRSLVLTYVSRCGSSTPGSVYLMPDYDASDSPPSDEKSGSSFYGSCTDVPWKEIPCRTDMRRSKELFLRNGPPGANLDIKTYDFCTLHVGTTDGAVAGWGKIYAHYVIDLINPQAVTPLNVGGFVTSLGGGIDTSYPFGLTPNIVPGSYVLSADGRYVHLTNLVIGAEYFLHCTTNGTVVVSCAISSVGLTSKSNMGSFVASGSTAAVHAYTYVATATTADLHFTIVATTVTGTNLTFAPVTNVSPI